MYQSGLGQSFQSTVSRQSRAGTGHSAVFSPCALRAGDDVLWSPAVVAAPIPGTAEALAKEKLPLLKRMVELCRECLEPLTQAEQMCS